MDQMVLFMLDDQTFGLPIVTVERIVRVVEITGLPNAPKNIMGVVNVHGHVTPVLNLRYCLGLPQRALGLLNLLIISSVSEKSVAFVADSVIGVFRASISSIKKESPTIENMIRCNDQLIMVIHDLGCFMALDVNPKGVQS